jgi:hypothetical protein
MRQMRVAIVLAAVLMCGCANITSEELADWQQASAYLTNEIQTIRSELELTEDPVVRAKLEAALDDIQPHLEEANRIIQSAQTGGDVGWGLLEAAVAVAAGFFPGIGVLVPLVRSARRTSRALITSVEAGGGPTDPLAAGAALDADKAARKFYDANKVS